MADQSGGVAAHSMAEQPAPPMTQRRPRVREVSSRFMSPLIQSNSTPNPSDLIRTKSIHRCLPPKTDENQIPEANRSFDKSSASTASSVQRKSHQKLKDQKHSDARVSSRHDTPITIGTDRVVASNYRHIPNSICGSKSQNSSIDGLAAVTAAARLLQEMTSDGDKKLQRNIPAPSGDDLDCIRSRGSNQGTSSSPNSPLCVPKSNLRSGPDTRSSMPDVDKWLVERVSGNSGKATSDCCRSLNFTSSVKLAGGISLPPHPSSHIRASSGLDVKKGRKGSNQHNDGHSLKMLHNHYLQWCFVNAKAEAAVLSQKKEAETEFHAIGSSLSGLRDIVQRKRFELAVLREIKKLTTIVEAQMPRLEEWATLQEDYSTSLSGTANALLNSSVRLPVSGIRADVGELREAMTSAVNMAELIRFDIQTFTRKAEEMDSSVSELAKIAGRETALVEECGDVLSKSYISQVSESSLRSTLMQIGECNELNN